MLVLATTNVWYCTGGEMGSYHSNFQAGIELVGSGGPSALAFQVPGTIYVHHHAHLTTNFFFFFFVVLEF
jgi:hypothetical protein